MHFSDLFYSIIIFLYSILTTYHLPPPPNYLPRFHRPHLQLTYPFPPTASTYRLYPHHLPPNYPYLLHFAYPHLHHPYTFPTYHLHLHRLYPHYLPPTSPPTPLPISLHLPPFSLPSTTFQLPHLPPYLLSPPIHPLIIYLPPS